MDQKSIQLDVEQVKQLFQKFLASRVGIVGGGHFCFKLLRFLHEENLSPRRPVIIGVADINPNAEGIGYARELGIYTTNDYRDLFALDDLQMIVEITQDTDLGARLHHEKPGHVCLMDHFHARNLWDVLRLENLRISTIEELLVQKDDPAAVERLFEKCFDSFNRIIARRNARSRQIEMELVENQRTQAQIIQGSTIPTFFINKDHIVTHWNKAMEALTGWKADQIVGTNHQWAPFWKRERPSMADVILDQIDEDRIHKLYGNQWRKSTLIEGGYEAEIFFPQVGQNGKWLWFTAAPIKGPDGAIVGAIETLWDKTEDKRAEEEHERHTAELSALLAIYTALSAPWELDQRLEATLKEVQRFIRVDDVRIYLKAEHSDFFLAYRYAPVDLFGSDDLTQLCVRFIAQVAEENRTLVLPTVESSDDDELSALARSGVNCLGLIPIGAKEKKTIGVLLLAGRAAKSFAPEERHVLDLIGNRIGVAIENAMLQAQNIQSEKKYRSLFNNDPNPIFILRQSTLEITDINERAVECYGYSRDELVGMHFMRLFETGESEVPHGLAQLPLGHSILFSKKRHLRKDGSLFFVNINAGHRQHDESGLLIVTTTDITESVRNETQLIQASKMTTLGLMAAGMAHEINQPLNVIQICADIILKMVKKGQAPSQEELTAMAGDIVANVERATGIIRHVREFARQSEVIKSRININAPIMDIFKVMGHQIKAHQITLDLDLAPDIPFILAEHNRLEQVFINLVTNAIDAMDEKAAQPEHKSMTKQLTVRSRADEGRVIATVADNGIGMSEEVQQKIFEPFFTTKQIGKGTGLGVSISYGIVKDYGGTIAIHSRVGQGTTFTLTFPGISDAA